MTAAEARLDLHMARCVDLRITQADMAKLLGVSLRTYARYERNAPPLSIQKLVKLLVSQPCGSRALEPGQALRARPAASRPETAGCLSA